MPQDNMMTQLRDIAANQLPAPVIIIGYLEHQIDLLSKLVKDISGIVDPTKITPEIQQRLDLLDQLLEQSSIDFANMSDQFQSYKLPNAIELKRHTRRVQQRYLKKQLEEGLLGEKP